MQTTNMRVRQGAPASTLAEMAAKLTTSFRVHQLSDYISIAQHIAIWCYFTEAHVQFRYLQPKVSTRPLLFHQPCCAEANTVFFPPHVLLHPAGIGSKMNDVSTKGGYSPVQAVPPKSEVRERLRYKPRRKSSALQMFCSSNTQVAANCGLTTPNTSCSS